MPVALDMKICFEMSLSLQSIFSKLINSDNSLNNIKEYKEAFNEMLNDKNSLKYLATIIRSAVKNGPNCFPFVIVH